MELGLLSQRRMVLEIIIEIKTDFPTYPPLQTVEYATKRKNT